MVLPEYQGLNIGTEIINNLWYRVNEYKKVNPNIRVYLGAAKGKEGFYEKIGFMARPTQDLGPGMILKGYNE